jgi:probable HAF family extracellular repeat protein
VPNANGSTVINLDVSDGITSTTGSFTLNVSPRNDQPSASQTCLNFDGNNDGVFAESAVGGLGLNNVSHTIEAWIKPEALPVGRSWPLLLGQPDTGSHHWLLQPSGNPNQVVIQFGIWNGVAVVGPTLDVGTWSHVAATWSAETNTLTVFINGVQVGQLLEVPLNSRIKFRDLQLTLGIPRLPESYFKGQLDELRIWNRALAREEIERNRNYPLSGRESGLVLYWRFDEITGTRAIDSANDLATQGGRCDGVLSGGPTYAAPPGSPFGIRVVDEDKPTPVFLPGYDIEVHLREPGASLSYIILTPPAHGALNYSTGDWNPRTTPAQNPVSYTPNANYNGPDSFTYTVRDQSSLMGGIATVQLSVQSQNDDPTISGIPNQLVEENTASAALPFTITDAETPLDQLELTLASTDNTVLSPARIELGGSGANRTMILRPALNEIGTTSITITVGDRNGGFASTNFQVRVVPRPAYALVDLGGLPGQSQSFGHGINDSGWIAGAAQSQAADARGFIYRGLTSDGRLLDVGDLGGPSSVLWAINNANIAVGYSSRSSVGRPEAVLWSNGFLTGLGVLTGGTVSEARAINNPGTVVGWSEITGQRRQAVRWTTTGLQTLTTLGSLGSEASGINDFGIIVGYIRGGDNREGATYWNEQNQQFSVDRVGGFQSRAIAINNSGQIVGYVESATGVKVAFLYEIARTNAVQLGTLLGQAGSLPRHINDFGQVVGQSGNAPDSQRAFLYSARRLHDLNELIHDFRKPDGSDFVFSDSNWVLKDAISINRDGYITGAGTFNGNSRAFLAVPAWVIGRNIARPAGAVARMPEIELIYGQPGDTPQNSFFWSNVQGKEGKLYAIRPVTAKLKWFTSFTDTTGSGSDLIVNSERIIEVGMSVWPKNPTIHIATVPVQVEPEGVPFAYSFQSAIYSTVQGVTVDSSTKRFLDVQPGYTVLHYLKTDGFAPNPTSQEPVFDVIKTVTWDDPAHLLEQSAEVGEVLTLASHSDYQGQGGYVFFENAFYDGAGLDRAYDRRTRQGPIIPVNKRSAGIATPDNQLVVVWYHTNRLRVAWADTSVRYEVQWPAQAPTIIIASELGSGLLNPATYLEPHVYNQPDAELPGYNPNEEHALMAEGKGGTGTGLYALRSDLNALSGHSEPYALLKYREPVNRQWRIKPYRVVAEQAPYFFRYPGEAGSELRPPYPLWTLPLCEDTQGVEGPWWEDYHGKLYARAAGPNGDTTQIVVRYFYPLQPDFWYDLNLDRTNDFAVGTCLPWLDRLQSTPGIPVDINYQIRWPEQAPVLEIGATLINGIKDSGLPSVKNMARVEVIYDDLAPGWDYLHEPAPVLTLARLYDPLSARKVKLPANWQWPEGIARENVNGQIVFPQLPATLKQRLTYDPQNKTLTFAGLLDENFNAVGAPLLLPNVLSPRELERSKQLAPGNAAWANLLDQLFWLTRNPNQVDLLPRDGQPDLDLRVGLTTNATGEILFEQFGDGPKSLTAGSTNIPPAVPRPGLAFSNGAGAWLAVQNFGNLNRDFTISIWAKLAVSSTGSLFTNSPPGGGGIFLRPNRPLNTIQFSDRSANSNEVNTLSLTLDNEWHHFALVRSGTNLLLYVDARLITTRPALGQTDTRDFRIAERVFGQVDEFEIWGMALSSRQLRSLMSKALNGKESGLRLYLRFDDGPNVTEFIDATTNRYVATRSGLLGSILDSTAPAGIPARYITLAENNDPTLPGLPIGLHVIRVEDGPYPGELQLIPGDNVFDERITLRHSSDFGAAPEQIEFEWYYKPDTADFDENDLPQVNPTNGVISDFRLWQPYRRTSERGDGLNEITIGEGSQSSLLTLGDFWFICRYRNYAIGTRPATAWSDWVGEPGSADNPRAQLVEGWIKRVIRGLNPFDARTKDFHVSAVNTYSSMLVQAGKRFEGAIAFNGSPDNLNSIGLIEAYQTVLERGKKLSIEGSPPETFDAANNALVLVSSRLCDLYLLLGHEAYADAQDPTIGFGTSGGEYGSLAPSIFAFQNQLDSLLEEELVLLRGRDDRNATTSAGPVYNRAFWNFTLGEGEVAYQQTYNISDQNADGFIDERDARILYPQGHGDAWGHYLTALKFYYALMQNPNFAWKPRSENVLVGGVAVEVDFLDERKFALAAAARAKTGREIVDLEYRNYYVEDPAGQWQGYKDTDPDRAWGVDEWGRRVGQGAFFDWLAANAVLPSIDANPTHVGIQKIDRTTVAELNEIVAHYDAAQAKLDESDAGLNPLGLAKSALPFDIDPTFLEVGSTAQIGRRAVQGLTQFDQILERAIKALQNATTVWDRANRSTELLRRNQDSTDAFTRNLREQEFDYKNRLIELFGYPYAGDIGPGRPYPSGYDGPDLYRHMYINVTEITGENSPPSRTFTGYFTAPRAGLDTNDYWLGFAPAALDTAVLTISFPVAMADYGFAAPPELGARRAPGELQMALSDLVQANAQLKIALQNYDGLVQDITAAIDLLSARYQLNADKIKVRRGLNREVSDLNKVLVTLKAAELTFKRAGEIISDVTAGIIEGVPESAIFGLADGGDLTGPVRATIALGGIALKHTALGFADIAEGTQHYFELSKEEAQLEAELDLEVLDQRFEVLQQIKELEHLIRNEAAARLEAHTQAEVVRQAAGRYLGKLAEGDRLIQERIRFRRDASADVTEARYEDMTFRIFRNDALQKYRAAFDIAARYVYLAANAYDYEINFLGTDQRAGRRFLTDIVRQRSLGQLVDGDPAVGTAGLADALARMEANWAVLKPRFGVINPQIADTRFSLREELFRIAPGSDAAWQDVLKAARVENLWSVPEFRRYCRPFAPESAGAQPAIVIRFPTRIIFGLNYFGWPLAGGDSAYDPSQFSTKISRAGIWFSGSDGTQLAQTPRVYLFPVGMDTMRAPTGDTLATRQWRILDQVIPAPFSIGSTDLNDPDWIPMNDALGGNFAQLRRYAALPARHDSGDYAEGDMTNDTRLIGRSAWNTEWMLIIPGGTLLADADDGLNTFIDVVSDIKIYFQTYSYSGD